MTTDRLSELVIEARIANADPSLEAHKRKFAIMDAVAEQVPTVEAFNDFIDQAGLNEIYKEAWYQRDSWPELFEKPRGRQ